MGFRTPDLSGYRTFVKPENFEPAHGHGVVPFGRDIGNFQFTAPENVPVRTVSVPGDQYVIPYAPATNMPVRRVFGESFMEEEENLHLGAIVRIKSQPKVRQRKQRGKARLKKRRNYLKNRIKQRNQARKRYRKIRMLSTFKKNQQIRRKHPERFKRLRASVLKVASVWQASRYSSEDMLASVDGMRAKLASLPPAQSREEFERRASLRSRLRKVARALSQGV